MSRIHLVFHVSLLEPADQETLVDTRTQLELEVLDGEFEVEKIINTI
jgi:hypothetical protein